MWRWTASRRNKQRWGEAQPIRTPLGKAVEYCFFQFAIVSLKQCYFRFARGNWKNRIDVSLTPRVDRSHWWCWVSRRRPVTMPRQDRDIRGRGLAWVRCWMWQSQRHTFPARPRVESTRCAGANRMRLPGKGWEAGHKSLSLDHKGGSRRSNSLESSRTLRFFPRFREGKVLWSGYFKGFERGVGGCRKGSGQLPQNFRQWPGSSRGFWRGHGCA